MEPSSRINVGIIGIGHMGILHAAILNSLSNAKTVAVCDKDARLIKIMSKLTKSFSFYDDYDKMCAKESIDALYLCTPPQARLTILKDLRTKIHRNAFFVEKPLAIDFKNARMMLEMLPVTNSLTMVGFQKRYSGTFARARKLVLDEVIGEILTFNAHHYASENYGMSTGWKFERETGGVAIEFGPHLIDLVLWYFGEPDSIKAVSKRMFSSEVEDYIHSIFSYKTGVIGSLDVCWSMRNFRPAELAIEIHGTCGTINVNEDRILLHLDKDSCGLLAGTHFMPKSILTPEVPFLLAYPENVLQDQHFVGCIIEGRNPENDFESASKVNKIIDAIKNAKE
jgi:predicted dehydrogenase